jgi:hypothetical membrane protein
MPEKKEEMVIYSETVRPPFWLLAFIFFLLGSVALAIWAAFDNRSGLIALIIALALLPVLNYAMVLRISLTERELRVGRAHARRCLRLMKCA